jgi:hypothetical protein
MSNADTDFLVEIRWNHVSPGTINVYHSVLHKFFSWLREHNRALLTDHFFEDAIVDDQFLNLAAFKRYMSTAVEQQRVHSTLTLSPRI